MDTLVIANQEKVKEDGEALSTIIDQQLKTTLKITKNAEEANQHIRKLNNPRIIITIGGDGTLTQAVQEAMRQGGETIMGAIPYDSGDYARSLGFCEPFKPLVRNKGILEKQEYLEPYAATMQGSLQYVRAVDIARIIINDNHEEPIYGINWVGIAGYFAAASHALQQYTDGKKPYLKTARQQRRHYANNKQRIELTIKQAHQRSTRRGTSAASLDLFLGAYFGGGKHITRSSLSDGHAELVTLNNAKTIPFYLSLASVLAGTTHHLKSKHVQYDEHVIGLSAHLKEPQRIQYDGESHPEPASNVSIELLPQALNMITNRSR